MYINILVRGRDGLGPFGVLENGGEEFFFLLFLFEKIYWLKEQTFWVFV